MSDPDEFEALPLSEQSRIHKMARALAELACSYSTYVFLVGKEAAATKINMGSAFIVVRNGTHVLLTAEHVLEEFELRKQSDPSSSFQAGECVLELSGRNILRDKTIDVAFLELTQLEALRIGSKPYIPNEDWPADEIAKGDYAQFCGFPSFFKREVGANELSIAPFAGFVEVNAVHPTYFNCVFQRPNWVTRGPENTPPAGTVLGGLSGGPVLLRAQFKYPVVGLVSEFQEGFEILRVARLPHPFPWQEFA